MSPQRLIVLLLLGTLAAGCGGTKVTRTDPGTTVDLSGRWNDADSRLTAEALAEDCLTKPWLPLFEQQYESKPPRVIVGSLRNKTHEHIAVETFVKDIERALLNSGRIVVVSSGDQREELREEREDQQYWSSAQTRKKLRNEYGADFMLQGTLNSIVDQEGKQKVVYYQADMTLTNLETNEKVWAGGHKIKKLLKGSSARW
jgi:penicillin-binding protein activator